LEQHRGQDQEQRRLWTKLDEGADIMQHDARGTKDAINNLILELDGQRISFVDAVTEILQVSVTVISFRQLYNDAVGRYSTHWCDPRHIQALLQVNDFLKGIFPSCVAVKVICWGQTGSPQGCFDAWIPHIAAKFLGLTKLR
jgi:hypothetical protein